MSRSAFGISAIFASTSRSPAFLSFFQRSSAFSSLTRSLIAALSSAVSPLDFLPVVLLAGVRVPFFAVFVSAIAKYLRGIAPGPAGHIDWISFVIYDGARRRNVTVNENDSLAEQFDARRTHLRAVAYRMLGSVREAGDAVQESWLRLSRSDASEVENVGGWLTTVTARVCLDMLRSRKARREEQLGPHVPEPIVDPLTAPRPNTRPCLRIPSASRC